jgi:nitrite reductase/ring-hydroxylating ferredoxin subunit
MTVLCHVDALGENQTKGFELGNDSVFAIKRDGQIYVYRNSCPHRGVELNWLEDQFLDSDGELIQCATHGALFVIESGECIYGPCRGQNLQPVAFSIEHGLIHLRT